MKLRRATSSSFGKINVFVGMVGTTGNRANELEYVSEATTVVESDGEESVGTSQVGIVAEPEEQLVINHEKESLAEQIGRAHV